jgi:uncharacterized membrane protein YdjX (TVP38/TMEM64 family)
MTRRTRWLVGTIAVTLAMGVIGASVWIRFADSHTGRTLFQLYTDPVALRAALHRWGILAPLVFIGIQALQVLIAPIPGELTGLLGGFVFGEWTGLAYSMIGLTVGTFFAFAVGRWLGVAFVQRLVKPAVWARLGFVVEAEGSILCFLVYLIPGLPKDLLSYLFGLSPMPFWLFAVTSTLGRLPGTWVLSAEGAKTASGRYVEVALLVGIVAAVGVPLYAWRHLIVARFGHRSARSTEQDSAALRPERRAGSPAAGLPASVARRAAPEHRSRRDP